MDVPRVCALPSSTGSAIRTGVPTLGYASPFVAEYETDGQQAAEKALFALTTRSDNPGTPQMNESSLALRTPKGLAVVVSCSHPGIEKILEAAAQIDKKLYTSIGASHLVQTPREEIDHVAGMLHDTLKLERVAPGHCTSEPGFAAFMRKFGDSIRSGWCWRSLAVATIAAGISRGARRRVPRRLAGEAVSEIVQCASHNPHHQRRPASADGFGSFGADAPAPRVTLRVHFRVCPTRSELELEVPLPAPDDDCEATNGTLRQH